MNFVKSWGKKENRAPKIEDGSIFFLFFLNLRLILVFQVLLETEIKNRTFPQYLFPFEFASPLLQEGGNSLFFVLSGAG